ncbi:hypothetical protein CKW48_21520 [Bordetella pertussis]|nr:hypothetical protein CKW48_21520 [Bordetella pertussis]
MIGYEKRALAREDFNNDAVDAGELAPRQRNGAVRDHAGAGGRVPPDRLREARPGAGGLQQ